MDHTTNQFDVVRDLALELSLQNRLKLIEVLQKSVPADENGIEEDDKPFTPEEIKRLTTIEPLSPEEIIEAGLLGGWEDMGIEDSVEWVQEQRRKARYEW